MKVPRNNDRIISGHMETKARDAKERANGESVLAGPVFVDRHTPKPPKKMQTGSGAPSLCWVCLRQLQRAPGKGLGLFYFNLVVDKAGVEHRVHGSPCFGEAIQDGCKVQS